MKDVTGFKFLRDRLGEAVTETVSISLDGVARATNAERSGRVLEAILSKSCGYCIKKISFSRNWVDVEVYLPSGCVTSDGDLEDLRNILAGFALEAFES